MIDWIMTAYDGLWQAICTTFAGLPVGIQIWAVVIAVVGVLCAAIGTLARLLGGQPRHVSQPAEDKLASDINDLLLEVEDWLRQEKQRKEEEA